MPRNARIDAYIAKQADFARPILTHLRRIIHAACPETEETIKWGMPAFLYRGRLLAHMAAFKAHAAFGFWRGSEVAPEAGAEATAMGQFGRLTSLADLPEEARLIALVQKAMALEDGASGPRRPKRTPKPEPEAPEDLAAALGSNEKAAATFAAFPPSARRDYVEWITEAKRPGTRARRIAVNRSRGAARTPARWRAPRASRGPERRALERFL